MSAAKYAYGAVGFDDHAVFVVAMLGRFEPGRAVFLVDVAGIAQVGDRLLHLAVLVQAVLVEPHIEVHAEFLHGLANLVEHHWHRALAELLTLLGIAFAQRLALLVGARRRRAAD